MSEINGDAHRARRRAVRSAGPPPVEDAAAGSVTKKVVADAARLGDGAAPVTNADSAVRANSAVSAGQAKDGESAEQAKSAESAVRAKGAESAVQAKNGDSAEQAKSGDSAGQAKDADSAPVRDADSVALTKGEPAEGAAADSETAESASASSVDLGKADAETKTAAADESSDSGDADETAASSDGDRPGIGRILAMAASAVLVLALVAGAVVSVVLANAADERAQRRTDYVQTARQAILNLTTIRADSAKEDIDRILSLASGQFKTEFDGRVDPFLSVVQQAKVVSNGEIVEAALESDADESAKVLVAAKQTLTNAGQAEPQTRFYRFRVTVTRADSGLSASNVEFVP
ncbi:hypothetical protein [Nocardia lijiangensis]|uniref:hypothetical protein n=1 Tax=Nocardia lijiangensis TaxID=299618 RepID=UPI003D717765